MITEEHVEKALDFLARTAKEYAELKGQVGIFEYKLKIIEASEYLEVETGTQEYKKSAARNSKEYSEAVETYKDELERFTYLQSMRKTAEMKISVWQSIQKSKSQGVI